jgi:hypothetical protein
VRFDASESAALVQAMVDAGFTDEEIGKITGENVIAFLAAHLPAS